MFYACFYVFNVLRVQNSFPLPFSCVFKNLRWRNALTHKLEMRNVVSLRPVSHANHWLSVPRTGTIAWSIVECFAVTQWQWRAFAPVCGHHHQDGAGFDAAPPGSDVERRWADVVSVHLAAGQLPVLAMLSSDHHDSTSAFPQRRL